jgi:hypothetical protein
LIKISSEASEHFSNESSFKSEPSSEDEPKLEIFNRRRRPPAPAHEANAIIKPTATRGRQDTNARVEDADATGSDVEDVKVTDVRQRQLRSGTNVNGVVTEVLDAGKIKVQFRAGGRLFEGIVEQVRTRHVYRQLRRLFVEIFM